jgi:hypothetical protein
LGLPARQQNIKKQGDIHMNQLAENTKVGLQQAWANIILFVPKLLACVVILVIGYCVAKFLCKIFANVLQKLGFDRLVERGGVKRALSRTNWDASDLLGKLLFYFIMLFALQIAFGVFGPNPISSLLNSIIAYLPNVFVACVIIMVIAAVAEGAKQIIQGAIGGLSYGRPLAMAAAVAIWTVGVFAALNQLGIAPAIVNGLFYAMLAVIVGSAIVGIGGGSIVPLRGKIERLLGRVEEEALKIKATSAEAGARVQAKAESWPQEAVHAQEEARETHEKPRFEINH